MSGLHDGAGEGAEPAAAADLARSLGAQDVLIFRRLRRGEWLHTGGAGRRPGWAGLVVEDEASEPLLHQAVASRASVRVLSATPTRVVGPFLAGTAALLSLPSDGPPVVAVWGHPGRSQRLLAATDAELREASLVLLDRSGLLGPVSPTQLLSEELEVLHAVQEVTAALDQPLAATLEKVSAVVATAVGAQVAAAWVDRGRSALVTSGWEPPGSDEDVVAAAASAVPPPGAAPLVCHDAALAPLPAPLSPQDGIRSYLLVPLDVGGGGSSGSSGIMVARTAEPAPFGDLAQRLLVQVARAAGALVSVALARTQMEEQLTATRLRLGQDALTEAGSRHRWDEEVERAQALVDSGVPVTVALLDLDDLKWVNDTHGHLAGDALLQTCAQALRGVLRGGSDVVARVGGDEFAVLVARATDTDALAARLQSVDGTLTPDGLPVRVSVGVRQCLPGEQLADTLAEADAAMYAEKRRRRAEPR